MSSRKVRQRRLVSIAFGLAITIGLASCGGSPQPTASGPLTGQIRIQYNFGSSFFPLMLVRDEQLIQSANPGVQVTFTQSTGGGDSLTTLGADQADVATMGLSDALVGIDKGVPVCVSSRLASFPGGLVSNDPRIQSISDFRPTDRIAVPGPITWQAITLKAAAAQYLGAATKLDANTVTMNHPDGVTALRTHQIAGHFTVPPYFQQELASGGHVVLGAKQFWGDLFPANSMVIVSEKFRKNRALYNAFTAALAKAENEVNKEPDKAAAALAANPNNKLTQAGALNQMTKLGVEYDSSVPTTGSAAKFANALYDLHVITKKLTMSQVICGK